MSKGDNTRRLIVGHALKRATTEGLDGLSIGTLAADLGLSKSGLFAHFRSKQALQLQVLTAAQHQFIDKVVRPALTSPRGEPRVRALFEGWVGWSSSAERPGGCIFVAASSELDDQPGPLRDLLAELQYQWTQTLERSADIAVQEGHFRADLDRKQFAFELYSLLLGRHLFARLLEDPDAAEMTRTGFERLLASVRA